MFPTEVLEIRLPWHTVGAAPPAVPTSGSNLANDYDDLMGTNGGLLDVFL